MKMHPLLHILPPRIPKHLRRPRRIRPPPRNPHHLPSSPNRILPILPKTAQTPRKHLFEPNHHDAIRHTMADHIARHVQARGPRAAVVVDIVDGDLGHAELVEDALAAGGVAVAVAGNGLIDIVVVELGVEEGFDAGFEAEFGVIDYGERCGWLERCLRMWRGLTYLCLAA